jgi:excisionase family DNA binding protein
MPTIQFPDTDELCDKIVARLKKELSFLAPTEDSIDDIGDMVTIDRAAQLLNLSKNTLYNFTSSGTIPFSKKGKRVYFSKNDLSNWLHKAKKL